MGKEYHSSFLFAIPPIQKLFHRRGQPRIGLSQEVMGMKKKRGSALRRFLAVALSLLTLWAVVVTVGSDSVAAAMAAVRQRSSLPTALLRWELGDYAARDALSAVTAMAIGQSPLLLAGRGEVTQLWTTAETSDSGEETPQPEEIQVQQPQTTTPSQPQTSGVKDNGVAAQTIAPASPAGYDVVNGVYVKNTSIYTLDAAALSAAPYQVTLPTDAPQVLIVHTHGSEAYTMPPGEEYVASGTCRTADTNYSVVRVGDEIASVLSSYGLSVVHDRSLYDDPEYDGAYTRSLASIESYVAKYPSITYILDVHRDAIEDGNGNQYKLVSKEDPSVAQVSLVVGTSGSGQSFDNWQENLKFALSVQQTAAAAHPTLMRPIYVRNSRYNQHITTGSLLVEVGAAGNSLEEALNGARLFAAGLGETICRK